MPPLHHRRHATTEHLCCCRPSTVVQKKLVQRIYIIYDFNRDVSIQICDHALLLRTGGPAQKAPLLQRLDETKFDRSFMSDGPVSTNSSWRNVLFNSILLSE